MLSHAFLIPLIMAVSFLLILAFGKKLPRGGSEIGIAAVGICFVLALLTGFGWIQRVNNPPAHFDKADSEVIEHTLTTANHHETSEPADGGHGSEPADDGHGSEPADDGHGSEPADGGHGSEPADGGHGSEPADGGHGSEPADGGHGSEPADGGHGSEPADGGHGSEPADDGVEHDASEGAEAHHEVLPVSRSVTWFQNQGQEIKVGTLVDGLSTLMLLVVTLISLLVHIYSTEYVQGDRRFTHYFAFLSLFTASMLMFVLTQSTLQLIVGWELVGLCSFALIGHWWEDKPNSDAALKAFLTNRVGDVGLLVGMIILYFAAKDPAEGLIGSFDILRINTMANTGQISHTALLVASLCLLTAVMSKSGQFILHTWLPDAMAGPTPVSALIHAATMVVAGVYMVARLYPVFWHGLEIGNSNINALAVLGTVTLFFGALLAFVQSDIKKVLAYSTVSQLGFMVMALGVGAWTAAIFHLFTHALFKACLFLGAGSMSHACHHSFDMKKDYGGLRKYMPKTFATFMIGTAALMGIFPLAGFWSKDEILAGADQLGGPGGYKLMYVVSILGAMCTAAYMTRAIYYCFYGEPRGHAAEHEPHESPARITVPLIILAVGAVFAGFVNLPAFSWLPEGLQLRFEHYVEPVTPAFPSAATFGSVLHHPEFSGVTAVLSSVLAILAASIVYLWYWRGLGPHGITERNRFARAGYRLLENKYYLDRLYTDIIAGAVKGSLARAANWFNQNILDGIVNRAGLTARQAGEWIYTKIDQGVIDNVVKGSGATAGGTGQLLRKGQTGKVQTYGAYLFGAAAVLAAIFAVIASAS